MMQYDNVGLRSKSADNGTSNLIKRRKCIKMKAIKRWSFSMQYGELTVNAIKMLANSIKSCPESGVSYSIFLLSKSLRKTLAKVGMAEWVLVGDVKWVNALYLYCALRVFRIRTEGAKIVRKQMMRANDEMFGHNLLELRSQHGPHDIYDIVLKSHCTEEMRETEEERKKKQRYIKCATAIKPYCHNNNQE